MTLVPDHSRPIEEEKADEFSEIVRNEVRSADGFAEADETARDAIFLGVAQKFMEEDGGFLEADRDDPEDSDAGEMTPAFFKEKIGSSNTLIFGYMPLDAFGRLTLFTARYEDDERIRTLAQSEFRSRLDRAYRFFRLCCERSDQLKGYPAVSELATYIENCAETGKLTGLRIVFATNIRLTSSDYDRRDETGIDATYDVYDIDRLYRTSNQSISTDDIDVDFETWPCGALPCLEATGKEYKYKSYLLMLDGETLAHLFRRYGSRLYDTNLRSYLESKTKVNKGMLATIRSVPQKFLAYNNGLTAIASRIEVAHRHGQPCVTRVVGLQIVNGAQTTSTIYKASTDKKNPANLANVHVVMKLTRTELEDMETFVPEITEFANTQNPIKGSDLQANKLIHRRMEVLARETMCPGAEPRQWFYERTRGAYQAALAREGTTSKKRLEFLERIPSTNRFDKTDLAVFHMAWSGRPELGQPRTAEELCRVRQGACQPGANRGPDRSQVLQAYRRQGDRLRFGPQGGREVRHPKDSVLGDGLPRRLLRAQVRRCHPARGDMGKPGRFGGIEDAVRAVGAGDQLGDHRLEHPGQAAARMVQEGGLLDGGQGAAIALGWSRRS